MAIRSGRLCVDPSVAMAVPATEPNGTSHDTEALYREHGAAVAALCGSLLRDRGETEDATQQVFLSAHRALLNGAAPREPRAWLLAVARNECYARFRQRAATPVPTGDAPETATGDASAQVVQAGELAKMWDEVERMPPAQREAFILREIRGLSYGQLADELSLSRPSVRSLLLRARARLRRRLGDVAAGLGGAPWVQALLRLIAGGDGASPVPAGTKAAAVGIGALALAGGGGLVPHHALATPRQRAEPHRVATGAHRAAAPVEDRARFVDRSFAGDRSRGRDGGSHESGERSRSSGDQSLRGSGRDGSDDTTAVAVAESSTDGHGGDGGSSSSGPGSSGSGRDSSGHDGAGSGTSGSTSGSDDGSASVTTPTSSGSSGSHGGGSGGSDGGGSAGGGGHDG
jgi:RNA polymerase sigma-70 factor, ECF subfamily